MRHGFTVLALGLALASGWAQAADPAPAEKTPQQNKMATCNKEADGKKGDERKAFMKECLSAKKETQQSKMKTCNVEAAGKAIETLYRANGLRNGHAERSRGGDGGKCVGNIVAAGDDERDVMGIAHRVERETAAQRQVHDICRTEIRLR